MYKNRHVTVIIPALNEAPAIDRVVRGLKALRVCDSCSYCSMEILPDAARESQRDAAAHSFKVTRSEALEPESCPDGCVGGFSGLVDQIVVCDNGSTDDTAAIAAAAGAMVVEEPERGYGAACLAALAAPVEKDLIVFVDADHSVVEYELPSLLAPLLADSDLVIGSRTLGQCEKGALTPPQAMGNWLASALMRLLWGGKTTDLGPFRAVTDSALAAMQMSDRKFGWTVEMQIRAYQLSFTTVEVPVTTRRRVGESKISGTVRGVIGAAHGILGTIGKLYWRQISGAHKRAALKRAESGKEYPLASSFPAQSVIDTVPNNGRKTG